MAKSWTLSEHLYASYHSHAVQTVDGFVALRGHIVFSHELSFGYESDGFDLHLVIICKRMIMFRKIKPFVIRYLFSYITAYKCETYTSNNMDAQKVNY